MGLCLLHLRSIELRIWRLKCSESLRPKIRINNEDREYFQSCIIFVLTCDQGSALFGILIFLKLRVFCLFVCLFVFKDYMVKNKQDWIGVRRSGSSILSFASCTLLNPLENFRRFKVLISSKTCQMLLKLKGPCYISMSFSTYYSFCLSFPGGSAVKNLPGNTGDAGESGLIPGSGRSPGKGNGSPLQYSSLENPTDRGVQWATVHGVTKSQTGLKRLNHCHHCSLGIIISIA